MTGRIARGPSLTEQAIDALRAEIASGSWAVGDRIPAEPELVERFGIGRNSLREAIRALVHAGLLETRQGDGTYVRATSDLAGAVARRTRRAQLLEVMEVRRALEAEAARLAALRRSDADVEELERLLAVRAEAWEADDAERFVAVDVELHRAIAAASGNAMLAELYDDVSAAVPSTIHMSLGDSPRRSAVCDHDALVAAIRNRDSAGAEAVTVRTLDHFTARMRAEAE